MFISKLDAHPFCWNAWMFWNPLCAGVLHLHRLVPVRAVEGTISQQGHKVNTHSLCGKGGQRTWCAVSTRGGLRAGVGRLEELVVRGSY